MAQVEGVVEPRARTSARVTVSMLLIALGALLVTVGPFQTWSKFTFGPSAVHGAVSGTHLIGGLGYIIAASGIVTLLSLFVPSPKPRIVLALLVAGLAGATAYTALAGANDAQHVTLGVGVWLVLFGAVLLAVGGLVGQLRDV
jgi:hypothetical protein